MADSNLLLLIKALTKNEMQYVTIHLSKNKQGSNLLKLFKTIRELSSTGNSEIAAKIKDRKFISQLNVNKHILYHSLLDALHGFNLRKSPYGRILTMLQQSEILLNKGLIGARNELLLKAGQMADEYELSELKLEVLRLKNIGLTLEESKNNAQETAFLSEQINRNSQLKHLDNKIFLFGKKFGERLTADQNSQVRKLFNEFKKKNVSANFFFNKFIQLAFLIKYYRLQGEWDASYLNSMKILKLFKQHPNILRMQLWRNRYFSGLNDLITAANNMSNTKTINFVYNETKNLDVAIVYKSHIDSNILDSYIQTGEFTKGQTFLNNIESSLPKTTNLYNTITLYANLALMNFGLGNYSKALHWLNEILNNPNKQLADFPYTGIIRLTRLLTYYELKKFDTLELEVRSTLNYMVKHKTIFKVDRLILDYLLKMISINDKYELRKVMEEARYKLVQLSKIKSEAKTFNFFDFISWFESKIEGKTFAEIIREK